MNYLEWLSSQTKTRWWHDSAIPQEIDQAMRNGALGVTTNPVLAYKALCADPQYWEPYIGDIPSDLSGVPRAEALLEVVTKQAAKKFEAIYKETDGLHGYALAQVNPEFAGDTDKMLEQGLKYASWADNIAVKLPTINAALPVIEALASRGIAVCTTLNFSVSQAMAANSAYMAGKAKASKPAPCFVVQQGGRLDDYLADIVADNRLGIDISDIHHAGNAICKRTYGMIEQSGSGAFIMPAGLRGVHHITEMSGARMVFSLQARVQQMILEENPEQRERIDEPVPADVIDRLMRIDEFRRAYEEDGIDKNDFIKFGVTQRTLSQFLWTGWSPLETYGWTGVSKRWF